MTILGIVCSAAILCFSETMLVEFSFLEKLIIFLTSQQILLFLKISIEYVLPSDSEWVTELSNRNIFIGYVLLSIFIDYSNVLLLIFRSIILIFYFLLFISVIIIVFIYHLLFLFIIYYFYLSFTIYFYLFFSIFIAIKCLHK